jgi:hypothetical protein
VTRARRVQAIRSRWRTRQWEYRQRNLAHGAWAKFREALALAVEVYAIDTATAEKLVGEGFALDSRGSGLQPPRRIIWIPASRAATLGCRRLLIRLDATLLAAENLALVPFDRTV